MPRDPSRVSRALLAGLSLLVVAMMAAVSFGAESVSLARAISEPQSLDRTIVMSARLPRVLLGVVSGGGLAAVGVAFQTLLRNPLAEPFILGVSGGAALGATLAIVFGLTVLSVLGASLIPLAAFAGGMVATGMVYAIARRSHAPSSTSMLLAGVVVNSIASAAITFLKTLISAAKAQELLFWLIGFLDVPSSNALVSITVYVGIGGAMLLVDAGRLNLLSLGDEAAQHLGVDVRALERRTFFACSLIVGGIVSVTGLIGFIGLMVPHALRRLFGPDVRVILPASLLAGGGTLVLCDLVSRILFRYLHTEPPVGAVTALIGGPLFLVLLGKRLPS